jgi:hypothetical protein
VVFSDVRLWRTLQPRQYRYMHFSLLTHYCYGLLFWRCPVNCLYLGNCLLPLSQVNALDMHTRDGRQGKTYGSCHKDEFLSQRDLLSTGRHLLDVLFITSLNWNLWTYVGSRNTRENSCIISHAQSTAVLQSSAFFTGIHFFSCGAATQRGSWPPHSWGF